MQAITRFQYSFPSALITLFSALVLLSAFPPGAGAADLRPFRSDGCSLFPDGTFKDRAKWCGCCLSHDIAYWQGGTEQDRKKADTVLRDCVVERTQDRALAETMYLGVRAGGHPAFPTWYRWAYGWPYGRGYKPLSEGERVRVREQLDDYYRRHPTGYCEEHHPVTSGPTTPAQRPPRWAIPVQSRHLKNFYKLDEKVYRSAQPDKKGFGELKAFRIGSILSLRDYHSDEDGKDFGLNLYRVRMEAGDISVEKVVEALRIIRTSEGPILIHCWHGSDRTGLVSAMYRIVFQGWTKEDAIDELMHGGYGYHSLYGNIPEFIMQADIEKVKQAVSER